MNNSIKNTMFVERNLNILNKNKIFKSNYNLQIRNSLSNLEKLSFFENINKINKNVYLTFLKKRFSYSQYFIIFLKKAFFESKILGLSELSLVLESNLSDEEGKNKEGKNNLKSHKEVLKIFMDALSIKLEKDFFIDEYLQLKNLDFYEILGVILYHEGTIPYEFSNLKKLRNIYYSNLNEAANFYLDDHISHDAKKHFPELLKAIINLNLSEFNEKKVLDGIILMDRIRRDFYISLELNF